MIGHKQITVVAGLAAIMLFGYGISRLFMLRFQAGDIYPPYSSLRADPLGTKALYDSFNKCAGISVTRNYQSLDNIDLDPKTTLMFLGDTVAYSPNSDTIPANIAAKLSKFIRSGGRLVITLLPRNEDIHEYFKKGYKDASKDSETPEKTDKSVNQKSNDQNKAKTDGSKDKTVNRQRRQSSDDEESDAIGHIMFFTNWMQTAFAVSSNQDTTVALLDANMKDSGLPAGISCYTTLCFTNISPDWKVIYQINGNPVMIERQVGNGSVLLSTPTFFVSNEGLRKERHPALLARIIGDHKTIVFDETHHNIFDSPGILSLCKKYNLRWVGFALLAMAILFIWQNTVSMVPVYGGIAERKVVEVAKGKDSASGLVNILRRNIPAGSLLDVCLAEWKKTTDHGTPEMKRKIEHIQRLSGAHLPDTARSDETVLIYNKMCSDLKSAAWKSGE